MLPMSSFSLLCWNARGLCSRACRWGVRSLVEQTKCNILCVQETKRASIPAAMLSEIAGPRLDGSLVLPALGTRGGVLLAWDTSFFQMGLVDMSDFAITASVVRSTGGPAWTLTSVYGPSDDAAKPLFLQDLARIRGLVSGPWLLMGDFNLIYQARDKSNSNLNLRLMASFRSALNNSDLKEIKLGGRRFTWSNEQTAPTLVRLDRAFCSTDWDLQFSAARLQAQRGEAAGSRHSHV